MIGTAFSTNGQAAGGSATASGGGTVNTPAQVRPMTPNTGAERQNTVTPPVLQGSNLSATGSASGTNQVDSNFVFRDQAVTASDQTLLAALRQKVEIQLGITPPAAMPVHFFINNGIVTLVGVVPNDMENQRILLMIQQTPGVVQVVDRLHVGPLPPAVRPQTSNPRGVATDQAFSTSDQALLMTLHQRVAAQLNIDSSAFATLLLNFSIQNGVVTIRGRVGSSQQKQALLATVQSTPGVSQVVDDVMLSTAPPFLQPTNSSGP